MADHDDNCAIPCIVCKTALRNIYDSPTEGNQPVGGLAFSTTGHYGTTLFDPMNGSSLEINICDPCLAKARDAKEVLIGREVGWSIPKIKYEPWSVNDFDGD
jgi:hypothetical protein